MKHVAIYLRVSSKKQDHRSQLPDLEHWANSQDDTVKFYKDKFSGRSMEGPGWKQLGAALRMGKISAVVIWRLDRLGRTVSGLATLFDELRRRRVDLISLRDGISLARNMKVPSTRTVRTPPGRRSLNVRTRHVQRRPRSPLREYNSPSIEWNPLATVSPASRRISKSPGNPPSATSSNRASGKRFPR